MEKLNKEIVDLILSEKFDENFWLFELGRSEAMISESFSPEHQFMNSFFDKGEIFWNEQKNKLRDHFCDRENKIPKPFVKNMTEGPAGDIVSNIISVLTSTYSLTMAIAIPLCAIALKKGFNSLCLE